VKPLLAAFCSMVANNTACIDQCSGDDGFLLDAIVKYALQLLTKDIPGLLAYAM